MSEPKLISPMLDNHIIGDPISDHNGVRCCPAITKDTGDKYIVKIISIPSSQTKLEALLLTGAYPDAQAALAYFKELSDDVVAEAKTLQKLSKIEGFAPYESWQVEPMEGETGYDVYLLSPYRSTLERQMRRNVMTKLGAINLGIDLCSALTVCRQSGYLFVDLKPSNVFITEGKQYLIGDLGFMNLNGLKYASLPDKYRSAYTAPEIADAFSALNTTVDIYAVGLILYQVFNGGELPFAGDAAPEETFPAPLYADYEMAEIIAKACAPDPMDRWQTPAEMGQALVSYMQRNGANDTPIIPPAVPTEESASEESASEEAAFEEEPVGAFDEPEEPVIAVAQEDAAAEDIAEAAGETAPEAIAYTEDDCGNLSFLDEMVSDDTAPGAEDADINYDEVSNEVSDILEQADDLIAHETPDPVIAPDPIDVPVPPPLYIKEEEPEENAQSEAPEDAAEAVSEAEDESNAEVDETEETEPNDENNFSDEYEDEEGSPPVKKKRSSKWILRVLLLILLAAGLILGGIFLYKNVYLQTISEIKLEGDEDALSVILTSDIPDEKLTVICSDVYGNKLTAPVVNGVATFTELTADKAYAVKVEIEGFHQLVGAVSATYNTPAKTNIASFSAITGVEDGSVILTFELDGPDSENWKVICSTPGEAAREVQFSGRSVTVNDLTVGTEYTFKLEPMTKLYVTGTDEITFTARSVVLAENVAITSCADGKLSASWTAPEGAAVESWTARYICNDGTEGTVTTTETSVTFEGIDCALGYTVEVTAEAMSLSQRASIMANTVTVTDFTASASGSTLTLTWNSSIPIGEDGWLLQYSVDDSETKHTVTCAENTATLKPIVPGAVYHFSLAAAGGNQILGGSTTFTAEKAGTFRGFGTSADYMVFRMCNTPSKSNWSRTDLKDSDYTTSFKVGKKASFLVRLTSTYNASSSAVEIVYEIRTAEGEYVSAAAVSTTWNKMFLKGYCELDIPSLPDTAGSYKITVYFNGDFAGEQAFTVTA